MVGTQLSLTFFVILNRFPLRDAGRLKQWLRNIKRVDWIPSDASRLCSEHFAQGDFCINEGVKISHYTLHLYKGSCDIYLNLVNTCQES